MLIKLADKRKIYEFSVIATNGNGESAKSMLTDTDENRIINWYPIPGEIFRRNFKLKYPFQMQKNK